MNTIASQLLAYLVKKIKYTIYCEANLCNSCIKQLIHNFYNELEQCVDLPSLQSLQVEQGNLSTLHCF